MYPRFFTTLCDWLTLPSSTDRWRYFGLLGAMWLLIVASGCASYTPKNFADGRPIFNPQAYFTGHTHSQGVFETRAGEPTKRFTTTATGRLDHGILLLDQDFAYDDGHHQQRHWRIRQLDAHRFEGTANDVVGTARGEADGNAFRWEYTVALKPGNPLSQVRLKQWMYLQPDARSMINHGTVKKLGVEVAQVTESFRHD